WILDVLPRLLLLSRHDGLLDLLIELREVVSGGLWLRLGRSALPTLWCWGIVLSGLQKRVLGLVAGSLVDARVHQHLRRVVLLDGCRERIPAGMLGGGLGLRRYLLGSLRPAGRIGEVGGFRPGRFICHLCSPLP